MITVPNHCFMILDRYVFFHSFISGAWGYITLSFSCDHVYPSELAPCSALFTVPGRIVTTNNISANNFF